MARNYPDLPLGKRSKAFRAIESLLRADPILRQVVKTWQTWEGDSDEDNLPASDDMCPYIRLTPMTSPSEREATYGDGRTTTRSPMTIQILTAVGGTCVDDSTDFWDAIEDALFPQDPATRQALDASLAAVGIQDVEMTLPAWGVNDTGGPVSLFAGTLKVSMVVST